LFATTAFTFFSATSGICAPVRWEDCIDANIFLDFECEFVDETRLRNIGLMD
jgi:hypothetical protein